MYEPISRIEGRSIDDIPNNELINLIEEKRTSIRQHEVENQILRKQLEDISGSAIQVKENVLEQTCFQAFWETFGTANDFSMWISEQNNSSAYNDETLLLADKYVARADVNNLHHNNKTKKDEQDKDIQGTESVKSLYQIYIDQRKIQFICGQEEIRRKNEYWLKMKSLTMYAKQKLNNNLAKLEEITKARQCARERLHRKQKLAEKLRSSINETEKEIQECEQHCAVMNRRFGNCCPVAPLDFMKLKDSLKLIKLTERNRQRHAVLKS